MSSNAVELAIKVTSDAKSAASDLDGATGHVSKLGKAGSIAGKLLVGGLLAGAAAAVKFTQAAAADDQAAAKLANTAKSAAGATDAQTASLEDYITAQGKAVGVADDELRPALGKLIQATGDVTKAQQLASLAMNVSADSGKSLDSVSQSLAKAYATGNVAALAKYGVATKDAAGNARSLADVTADLQKKTEGAADAQAGTAAGKAAKLQVQFGELQEQIGAKLLPVMLKLSDAGLKVVDWISKNQTAAGAIIGTLGSLLVIVYSVSKAVQAWTAITKAFTAIQTALNFVLAANPVVLVVIAIVALVAVLVLAYKHSETFRKIVQGAFGAVAKAAGAAVDFIKDHWRLILTIIAGPIGLAVALVTKHWNTIKAGGAAVISAVRSAWPVLRAVITGPFTAARTVVSAVWKKITEGFTTAKDTLTTTATTIQDKLVGAFNAIRDAVQGIIDKIQAAIDKIASLISKAKSIPGTGLLGKVLSRVAPSGPTQTAPSSYPAAGGAPITVHVTGFVGNDQDLAGRLAPALSAAMSRRGVALGVAVG